MAVSPDTKRVSISLNSDIVAQLDFVSAKLRCSRSSLLTVIIMESVDPLVSIATCLPDAGQEIGESDARRFRGESARIIGEQVTRMLSGDVQNDMFSK